MNKIKPKMESTPAPNKIVGLHGRELTPEQYAARNADYLDEIPDISFVENIVSIFTDVLYRLWPPAYIKSFCTIAQTHRGVLFRIGRLHTKEILKPGLNRFNPFIDNIVLVDVRKTSFDMARQTLLTKDTVTLTIDAVVHYQVFDPVKALTKVADYHTATRRIAKSEFRQLLSTKILQQILEEQDSIAVELKQQLDHATDSWGVRILSVDLKGVKLQRDMQRAMAQIAQAERSRKALILAADGEKNSANDLVEASDVINKNPCGIQLRYLQAMCDIGAKRNKTIILPVSKDLLEEVQANGFKNLAWKNA